MYTEPPRGFDPSELIVPPLGVEPWPIAAVAPDVAGRCNLACRYCAEAVTLSERLPMSEDILDAAWHLLSPNGMVAEAATIRLGSGEPMLAFPLLQRIAEHVERARQVRRPHVFLTTNGTLLTKEVCDWLVAEGWFVKISLDGPQHVHDAWRCHQDGSGTHAQAVEAARYLARVLGDRLSATAVLCRGTDPAEVFDAIEGLGVHRIELVPVAHCDPAVVPGPEDIERYARFIENYARRWIDTTDGLQPPALIRFEECVRRAMGYGLTAVRCGAGRSLIGVGPRGGLYPCFRFIGMPAYHLGDVARGLDRNAVLAFQQEAGRSCEKRKPCSDCWAAPLCGGPCFAVVEMFGPGGGHPVREHCTYARIDAWWAISLVLHFRRHAPERLLAFLPNVPLD